jgi:hypothetical protein
MFTSFVMITTEGWSAVLYNLWATWGLPYISTILVIIHMLFGACFLLELTLAVLWDQYSAATAAEGDHVNAVLLIVNKRLKADEETAAILADGKVVEKPVVKDGQIVVGNTMMLSLACDHRTIDGATGAQFLQTLKQLIENPVTMLA